MPAEHGYKVNKRKRNEICKKKSINKYRSRDRIKIFGIHLPPLPQDLSGGRVRQAVSMDISPDRNSSKLQSGADQFTLGLILHH